MTTFNQGDFAEVVLTWDTPLVSVAQNVWHLEMVSGAGADSDDILAELLNRMQVVFAFMEDHVSTEFEAVLLELRKWDDVNERFDGVGSLAVTGVVGLSVADYEPHGVAALGRVVTEVARRQGRTFLPGITQLGISNGVLETAVENAFALFLAGWDDNYVVTGGVLAWCTFNTDPLSVVYKTAARAIQTVVANSLPSYLTKRKPGIGL